MSLLLISVTVLSILDFNKLEGAWQPKFILEIEWFAHNCILIVASTSADVSGDITLDLVFINHLFLF